MVSNPMLLLMSLNFVAAHPFYVTEKEAIKKNIALWICGFTAMRFEFCFVKVESGVELGPNSTRLSSIYESAIFIIER